MDVFRACLSCLEHLCSNTPKQGVFDHKDWIVCLRMLNGWAVICLLSCLMTPKKSNYSNQFKVGKRWWNTTVTSCLTLWKYKSFNEEFAVVTAAQLVFIMLPSFWGVQSCSREFTSKGRTNWRTRDPGSLQKLKQDIKTFSFCFLGNTFIFMKVMHREASTVSEDVLEHVLSRKTRFDALMPAVPILGLLWGWNINVKRFVVSKCDSTGRTVNSEPHEGSAEHIILPFQLFLDFISEIIAEKLTRGREETQQMRLFWLNSKKTIKIIKSCYYKTWTIQSKLTHQLQNHNSYKTVVFFPLIFRIKSLWCLYICWHSCFWSHTKSVSVTLAEQLQSIKGSEWFSDVRHMLNDVSGEAPLCHQKTTAGLCCRVQTPGGETGQGSRADLSGLCWSHYSMAYKTENASSGKSKIINQVVIQAWLLLLFGS